MLLTVQFPFADSRKFLLEQTGKLGLPNWPATRRDIDFVRSFGTIRKRELGGLSSWVGENEVCEAARAVRFPSLPTFRDGANLRLPIGLAFRRLFYDGRAMGKFEVGISADSSTAIELLKEQTGKFLNHCLSLPIDIFDPIAGAGKKSKPTLARASKPLSKLYLFSTTKISLAKNPAWWATAKPDWWVRGGSPVMFLVHKETEGIQLPAAPKNLPLDNSLGFTLSYCEIQNNGKNIPLWVLGLTSNTNYQVARPVKINLLRLHAEHECLKLILQHIATNRISIIPKVNDPTHPSDLLQQYLTDATDRTLKLEKVSNGVSVDNHAVIAMQSVDMIAPGELESLKQAIEVVRPAVSRRVTKYLDALTTNIENQEVNIIVGDQFTVSGGNVGQFGKNIINHAAVYNSWASADANHNLSQLAQELSKLEPKLAEQKTSPEHDKSVEAVKAAATAALAGDGETVFSYLQKAGQWAYEIAKTVGIPVAMSAIKAAIGI